MKLSENKKPMSVSAFAKTVDRTPGAIRKAIHTGRLSKSIVIVRGKPKIADHELAILELAENTRPKSDVSATASAGASGYVRTRENSLEVFSHLAQSDLLNELFDQHAIAFELAALLLEQQIPAERLEERFKSLAGTELPDNALALLAELMEGATEIVSERKAKPTHEE